MNTWIAILPWLAGLHLVLVILVILRLAMNSHLLKNLNDVAPAGDESLP